MATSQSFKEKAHTSNYIPNISDYFDVKQYISLSKPTTPRQKWLNWILKTFFDGMSEDTFLNSYTNDLHYLSIRRRHYIYIMSTNDFIINGNQIADSNNNLELDFSVAIYIITKKSDLMT